MDDVVVLTILKFIGLGIGLAATIWGLTKNITSNDSDGRKRLTPAGHVAIALALGAFIVAGASQGFETLAKQEQARSSALAALERASRDAASEARAIRSEDRERQTLALASLARSETLARAAEQRAAEAEERLLLIQAAAAAQRRDVALSRAVNTGSRAILQRSVATLAQVDRLLFPIMTAEAEIEWWFETEQETTTTDLTNYFPFINVSTWIDGGGRLRSSMYERQGARPREAVRATAWFVKGFVATVGFFAAPADLSSLTREDVEASDYSLEVRFRPLPLFSTFSEGRGTFGFTTSLQDISSIRRSDRVASIVDLEQAAMVITPRVPNLPFSRFSYDGYERMVRTLRPARVDVSFSGRRFTASSEDIRPISPAGPDVRWAVTLRRVPTR